jgi:hypothetical protein
VGAIFFAELDDFLALLWGEERPDLEHRLQTVLLFFALKSPDFCRLLEDACFVRDVLLKQLSHFSVG